MDYLKEVCKGILIGVANIIPGVSGGTLAVSMGIYDRIIHAVTHIFKETKKSIMILLPYGIGAVLGIVGLSFLIEYLFEGFPLQTSMAFIGLIAGGLPTIWKRARINKVGVLGPAMLLLTFVLIILITASGGAGAKNALLGGNFILSCALFAIGIIAAATMVIPGVSGSMILMMLGYYQPIIETINQFIKAVLAFNLADAWRYGLLLVPFGLGVMAGVFLCAKIIEYLLSRFEAVTYYAIIGLVLSSPVVILWHISWKEIYLYQLLIGIALSMLGYVLASFLGGEE